MSVTYIARVEVGGDPSYKGGRSGTLCMDKHETWYTFCMDKYSLTAGAGDRDGGCFLFSAEWLEKVCLCILPVLLMQYYKRVEQMKKTKTKRLRTSVRPATFAFCPLKIVCINPQFKLSKPR
jgi:hypothetical protein